MATPQEIQRWFAANPNANDNDIANVMRANGVTADQVAQAVGKNPLDIQSRYDQAVWENDTPMGQRGAEMAVNSGLKSALASLSQGYNAGRGDLIDYTNQGVGAINQGVTQGRQDLTDSEAQAMQAYGLSYDDITNARNTATGQINQSYDTATGYFDPYIQSGQRANALSGDLSGLNGQGSFDAAYTESPYLKFLQEQGQRQALAGASASGGIGGGAILKELQRYGQGVSSQYIQQQIDNLNNLAGQGLTAGQAAGALQGQRAGALSGVTMDSASMLATQRANEAAARGQFGNARANLSLQGGQSAGQLYGNAGNTLASMGMQFGQSGANLNADAGNRIADYRYQTGQALSGQFDTASQIMAALQNQGGQNMSNAVGTGGANLADLLAQYGQSQATLGQNAASNMAGLPGIPNAQYTPSRVQDFGAVYQGMGEVGKALGW
jgi:hypothetical protein